MAGELEFAGKWYLLLSPPAGCDLDEFEFFASFPLDDVTMLMLWHFGSFDVPRGVFREGGWKCRFACAGW